MRVHRASGAQIGTIPAPVVFVTVERNTGGDVVATRDIGQTRACCLRIGEGCESGLRIAHARSMRLFALSLARALTKEPKARPRRS